MNIFESVLKGKKKNLTKTQQKIFSYLMENFDETVFLNASKIAQKTGVSESSVIRLAQTLGFEGYPSMLRELQRHFYYRQNTASRLANTIKEPKDGQDIFAKTMQEDMKNVADTLLGLSKETFDHAVSEILSAKCVYIFGIQDEYAPALVLANSLKCCVENVKLLEPKYGDIWAEVYNVEKGDLVIGLGFPRYINLTVKILEYAQGRGIKTGVITDSLVSPLSQHADWVLLAKCQLDSVYITYISTMSLIRALVTALSFSITENHSQSMRELELLYKQLKFYYQRANKNS